LVITTNADGAVVIGLLILGCGEMLLGIVGMQSLADRRKQAITTTKLTTMLEKKYTESLAPGISRPVFRNLLI